MNYSDGMDVLGLDWAEVRDRGFVQFQAMLETYTNAPIEVKRKYHAQALALQTRWNKDVGTWQLGFGQANTSAKIIGEEAEKLRAQIARDSGQGYAPIASGTTVTEDIVKTTGKTFKEAREALIPWYVWPIAGAVVLGIFVVPTLVPIITARLARRSA